MARVLSRFSVLRLLPSSLVTFALHALALPSEAIYVVVPAQSTVRTLSQQDLLALYTGRARTLPGADVVTPLDQQRDGPARAEFYQALTGMDIARINSYWARLHFTGQVQPPQTVVDNAAVVQRLRTDRTAIGYVTQEPQDSSVRVVLRLP